MSILLTLGFERQETTSERLAVPVGTVAYSSDVDGSGSEGSLLVVGETQAAKSYFGNYEAWLFFRLKRNASGGIQIGVSDYLGTNLLLNFDGSTLTATTGATEIASATISNDNEWHSYHVHFNSFFEDEYITVFQDGDLENPILEGIGEGLWGFAAPGYVIINGTSEADFLIDDVVLMDPTDATGLVDVQNMKNPTIKALLALDDGEKATQTAGDYTDINALPPDFIDKLVYGAPGQESTFVPEQLETENIILAKSVWERHEYSSMYFGNTLKLQLNIPGDADLYSDAKQLVESDVFTGEDIYGLEQIFEEGINGAYTLESFNEEEFGWQLVPFIELSDFCANMYQIKYGDYGIPAQFFVYACEDQLEGTNPVEVWYGYSGGDLGGIDFDTIAGDSSKITFVDVGGKHFVRTDKQGGMSTFGTLETNDIIQIYGAFVLRNVTTSDQLIFAAGNNANSFTITAKSDQTLEINGVASTIPYTLDQVYVFYAYSSGVDEGANSVFILDDQEYVCTIDHFDIDNEKCYLSEAGDASGLQADHITYVVCARSESEGPVDLGYFFLITDLIELEYDYEPGFGPGVFPEFEMDLFIYSGGVEALYEVPIPQENNWLLEDLQALLPAMAAR